MPRSLPPLTSLRAFEAAARSLSFTKAARELHVTPAAISHQIRGLEQFLEMLRLDRDFDDGLPRRALLDAFKVVDDADLVGRFRRRMASLLLV